MSRPGSRVEEVERAGLVLDVLDEGPADGVPVVLLHGFPQRSSCWRDVAPLLHREGVRTLAMDQRGYSPRARPPRRRDYALPALVADALELTERVAAVVGSDPHLVGHDWGAVIGWHLAGRRAPAVRSLTAVSVPHPAALLRAGTRSRQLLRSAYMAGFALPVLPEVAARRPGGPLDRMLRRSGMRTDELARFRGEVVDDGALPGGLGWYRALPFAGAGAGRARVPTTMVASDADPAVDTWGVEHCGELVADEVADDYRLVVLPGVSHWIPEHAPQALATAVLERVHGADPPGRRAEPDGSVPGWTP